MIGHVCVCAAGLGGQAHDAMPCTASVSCELASCVWPWMGLAKTHCGLRLILSWINRPYAGARRIEQRQALADANVAGPSH